MWATTSMNKTSETVTNDTFMIPPVFFASPQSKENMTMAVFQDIKTAQKTNDHVMIVLVVIFFAAILLFSIW